MNIRIAGLLLATGLVVGGGGGFAISHMMDAAKLALPTCAQVASDMSARDVANIHAGIVDFGGGLHRGPGSQATFDGVSCRG
jgi:hypothetical protein